MTSWAEHEFTVEMPHMVPGERISEVEFLKLLAAFQWRAIADMLQCPPQDISNDQGERLYGSVIDFEMNFGRGCSQEHLAEGARVYVRNRIQFFAKRFVEGFFVFGDDKIPDDALGGISGKSDIRGCERPWAYMTNAFIARTGSNTKLKVYMPSAFEGADVEEVKETPQGIGEHRRVESTGRIEPLDSTPAGRALPLRDEQPILYQIVPESDLNGAGLVYFARYLAMMNYGERIFLSERMRHPVSTGLVSCLSTAHRRVFFFANAAPTDQVHIDLSASLLPCEAGTAPASYRTPFELEFRIDLYRGSDRMLMASSLVRKSLNVPGDQKAVLREAERLLERLG